VGDQFRRGVLENQDALRAAMLVRSTQTNEPGRCAALLPVLAELPEPLALVEVGASAGLCLLPDFYAYDYRGPMLGPEAARLAPSVFRCAVNAATPIPGRLPRVVWRAGLDLKAAASAQQKRDLAAIIHLCGASSAKAFARRGFHPITGERCGNQEVATYLAQINAMTREFLRIEAAA
jgi:hypothetical protein